MDKSAETVNSLYVANALEPVLGQVRDRYLEVDPAVRALAVVVLDELAGPAVEMALVADEHPVPGPGAAPEPPHRRRERWLRRDHGEDRSTNELRGPGASATALPG